MVRSIPSPTILSLQQTATLLQNLVNQQNKNSEIKNDDDGSSVDLPEHIEKSINKFFNAHKEFVKSIDEYLHLMDSNPEENEIETVSTIVETCPQFLATEDSTKLIPLSCFGICHSGKCHPKYISLLAQAGRKLGIGGEEGRGGLILTVLNNLRVFASEHGSDVFKLLKNANPPFFFKEDIVNFDLLHYAVQTKNIEMIKYLIELDPSCLCSEAENVGCAIGLTCFYLREKEEEKEKKCLETAQYLLHRAIVENPSNPTVGGLFAKVKFNNCSDLVLNRLVKRYGEERTWDCIEKALSSFPNLTILHQTIKCAPQHCLMAMSKFPDSMLVRDANNRLPIHVALECGMPWTHLLVSIINANRSHLKDIDPITKWPPFVLAGLDDEKSCDLRTIYYLLRKNPEHVELIFNGGNKCNKRKISNEADNAKGGSKRGKTNK